MEYGGGAGEGGRVFNVKTVELMTKSPFQKGSLMDWARKIEMKNNIEIAFDGPGAEAGAGKWHNWIMLKSD